MTRITYRGYEIRQNDFRAHPYWGKVAWTFAHKDYDGPEDNRCGFAETVEDCMSEIDDAEEERQRTEYWSHPDRAIMYGNSRIATDKICALLRSQLLAETARADAAEAERQRVLDRAWADINALGGVATNLQEEAACEMIDRALNTLTGLGATDAIWRAEF
jgi:hypothetical protein